MRVLIDTNVLLRIADAAHPAHAVATTAVETLETQGHELVIVPQVLFEFWSVATRSIAANGLGKPPGYAAALISRYCDLFRLLRDERSIYEAWLQLVTQHGISGVNSYDTRLVAAMLRHQISHLLTFNVRDFRRYSNVNILEPQAIAAGTT